MVFKYKEIEFFPRTGLIFSLARIFGIGNIRANLLMDSMGFSRLLKTGDITNFHFSNLVFLLKSKFFLDFRLKELRLQHLEFFFSNSFVKGFRLFDGLSLKGRTHSNGSTAYRLKPFSAKLNDQILSRQRRISLYAKKRVKKTRR
jgi:ribosomal protein S13